MKKRYLPFLLAWLSVFGLPSGSPAQQRLGSEFQVNQLTAGDQQAPSVASDGAGNFVVVWESSSQAGILGRRYDSDGNPLSEEFHVNKYGGATNPWVTSDGAGNFVVVWENGSQDGSEDGVFGRRFDKDGRPLGKEFQVNTYTTYDQSGPSLAMDPDGNFVVVWSSRRQDGYGWGIFGQRFDAFGSQLGSEFQVNTYTGYNESGARVSTAANGNFVVVWGAVAGGSYYADYAPVRGQRYDSDGNPLGGELILGKKPRRPSVASDAAGNFIVVWDEYIEFKGHNIFAQRYDPSGNQVGNQFQVSTHTHVTRPTVSMAPTDGNFVVVWHNTDGQDGDGYGVFGQLYDSHGKNGDEFQVNTYVAGHQKNASAAFDPNGRFVVVWTDGSPLGDGQDGSGYGVFGQRFASGCQATVAVEGDVQAPGSMIPVQVHIAHHRPKTVTVPWTLRLVDSDGQLIARHTTEPHTFEPGDIVDRNVEFWLPDDIAAGTYTLELRIKGMAGTQGATMTFRVVRAE